MEWRPVLRALITDLGVRRFRLMSYWDELEKTPGKIDFKNLDSQIALIKKAGGEVTLCLGARQPRWPENHWPDWAWNLPKAERDERLFAFIEAVVRHYKTEKTVISYQLENEALLTNFGLRPDTDRQRLRQEFDLVRRLDPKTPIIMTTSTSWGIPIRRPIPDSVGFSYYQVLYNNGSYGRSFHRPWLDRIRAGLIRIIHGKPSFIHELQAEPWGPRNIWEMDVVEQNKSMSLEQLKENLRQAQSTHQYPIDLWGGEWWYWRMKHYDDDSLWQHMKQLYR